MINIIKLQVTIATIFGALTNWMKVSYVVRHEGANSALFQCIVSIL
jgi:hypothetical protein